MKSTGIVRKVDELGRVVIPVELRRTLDVHEEDAMEIFIDNDKIIFKKYKPNMACQITGDITDENVSLADGKLILSTEGASELVNEINKKMNL